MIEIFIILYLLIGMTLSIIWAIKCNETNEIFLSALCICWPLLIVLIFVGSAMYMGKIPIYLAKLIKRCLEERNDKNNKEG